MTETLEKRCLGLMEKGYSVDQIFLAETLLALYHALRVLGMMDESGHHEWRGRTREEIGAWVGGTACVLNCHPDDPEATRAMEAFVAFRGRTLAEMPYDQYLQTPEWKALRDFAIERAERRCETCNSHGPFHVHHRTYERRGRERLADVRVLCASCHRAFHENRTLAGP